MDRVNVVWTTTAERQLDNSYDYLKSKNPQAAKAIFTRVVLAARRLEQFPNIGRPGVKAGVRELVVPLTPYLIVYRVQSETVQILRVFHSTTNWQEVVTGMIKNGEES